MRGNIPVNRLQTRPLRVGVVGCGKFGARHANAWLEVQGAELVVVCDTRVHMANALGTRASCKHVPSIADLPADLDCVSIAVQPDLLEQAALQCLGRGWHVLLEKPFSLSVDGAHRLDHAARRRRLVLKAGYVERFHPALAAARTFISNPQHMHSTRISSAPTFDSRIGVVLDLMCHDIEHAVELGGRATSVQIEPLAFHGLQASGQRVTVDFDSGFTATLEAGYSETASHRTLTLSDTGNSISVDLRSGILRGPNCEMHVSTGNLLARQFEAFLDCIAALRQPAAGAQRAAEVLRVASMIAACTVHDTPLIRGRA